MENKRDSWIMVAQPNLEENKKSIFERLKGLIMNTAKANCYPTIIMLFAGTLFLVLYYTVTSVNAGLIAYTYFGTQNLGLAFPMITTGFFGGIVPSIFLGCMGHVSNSCLIDLIYIAICWAILGLIKSQVFVLCGSIAGSGINFKTILIKIVLDQGIYTPFCGTPLLYIMMLFKQLGFDYHLLYIQLVKDEKLRQMHLIGVLSQQIGCWITWLPGASFVFALPLPMQIPCFNMILVIFATAVVLLHSEIEKDDDTAPAKRIHHTTIPLELLQKIESIDNSDDDPDSIESNDMTIINKKVNDIEKLKEKEKNGGRLLLIEMEI